MWGWKWQRGPGKLEGCQLSRGREHVGNLCFSFQIKSREQLEAFWRLESKPCERSSSPCEQEPWDEHTDEHRVPSDPMAMEATQIPQTGAVQEPGNISSCDPSPKHQITACALPSKQHCFPTGGSWHQAPQHWEGSSTCQSFLLKSFLCTDLFFCWR